MITGIICFVAGTLFGIVALAICIAAGNADRQAEIKELRKKGIL